MRQYLDLLQHVMNKGTLKKNRTGIDTISTFNYNYEVDLREGFPLLTTKKINWKNILIETLWYLSGSATTEFLNKHGVKIWNNWADSNGSLGPVYGYQWRNWNEIRIVSPKTFLQPNITLDNNKIYGVGICDYSITQPFYKLLYGTWNHMLKRCYHAGFESYHNYGGKGVFVDSRWFSFKKFVEDVQRIEGWNLKKIFPEKYTLDKDYYVSNKYGPDTCIWSNKKEQSVNIDDNQLIRITHPNGKISYGYSAKSIADTWGLTKPCILKCLHREQDEHKGYKFEYVDVGNSKVRVRIFDQVENAVAELKNNPNSRRVIISAWNTRDLHLMALEPCHVMTTFNVQYDGNVPYLCLHMLQRSADTPIGVPYNIASYSFLLALVAHLTGIEPRYFAHTIIDGHIYVNQFEGVQEQLKRTPTKLPKLIISPNIKTLEDLDALISDGSTEEIENTFKIEGYDPQPFIKFPVAV